MKNIAKFIILTGVFVFTSSSTILFAEQKQDTHHHYKKIEIQDPAKVPEIVIDAQRDSSTGWNIHVRTTHFVFTPENAGKDHVAGQGHAHMYVDGKKVARLYSPWFHLPALSPGKHVIKVTLNANSHEEYAFKGELVSEQIEIVQN
jgi:hypothetical protein